MSYEEKAVEYSRAKARESSKKYYEENKDRIREKARERYRAKRGTEVGKPGRKPGQVFPDGYAKTKTKLPPNGAFKSPSDGQDLIFENLPTQ